MEDALREASYNVDILILKKSGNSFSAKTKSYLIYYWNILMCNFKAYDVIYLNHLPQVFLALLFKKINPETKICLHWHGDDLFSNNVLNRIARFLINKRLFSVDLHITPSNYYRSELCYICGVSKKDIFVSPSGGVDTEIFANSKKSKDLGKKNKIVLGFPSALTKEKGLVFLVQILKNLSLIEEKIGKKIKIEAINYGNDKFLIGDFSGDERLIINEVMEKKEMPSFYSRIDIVLMFSQRKAESLGLVSLEAMSCGCPIIGLYRFAMKEYIVPGKSGEFVEYNNIESFIESLNVIVNDFSKYEPSKFVHTNYSKKSVVDAYRSLFS